MPNPIELLQDEALAACKAATGPCATCQAERLLHGEGQDRAYPVVQRAPPWPVKVMAVMEAPNRSDTFDEGKRRLTVEADTDPTGSFMWELLDSVGLGTDQVLFTNSVLCLPAKRQGGKYPVSARQQDLCSKWLGRFIEVADPAVIITFGGVALQAMARLEHHRLALRDAGKLHPWGGRQLLPLYHPGLLGRVSRPAEKQKQDILVLREFLGRGQ
ncbi:uracil-DNA glycosylase family protein [Anaeromyxobacter paludicola]|uniref:Uracil-DNA glycosylase-like domain-containing protein n=1 Tax=Anaeromyxobacter paludicola TaxID=2918171 RepID=A0ABM7X8P6_9BACT|nr:uracil-DNA glycosylase family protein [Anaeromyxobacter paludicola]BDG08210.1 hypothetical protein AMPC_13230 [Anaeromyxobacter paludicola]